jgi:hypothetical protein
MGACWYLEALPAALCEVAIEIPRLLRGALGSETVELGTASSNGDDSEYLEEADEAATGEICGSYG